MSEIITELFNAVNSEITGDATIVSLTTWRGVGMAPTGTTGEWLGWFNLSDDNDDFMQAGADYYKDVDIQFSAHTDEASPSKARTIREKVENLFRFNTLTLSTGRHLVTEIGGGGEVEESEADGWTAAITLTFKIGT